MRSRPAITFVDYLPCGHYGGSAGAGKVLEKKMGRMFLLISHHKFYPLRLRFSLAAFISKAREGTKPKRDRLLRLVPFLSLT
jgi:hypothetical protein